MIPMDSALEISQQASVIAVRDDFVLETELNLDTNR